MAIRNSKELGSNLFIIAKRLLGNQLLCRLLVNTDSDPMAREVTNILSLLHKNIVVVPKVDEEDFNEDSKLALIFPEGDVNDSNGEFKNLSFEILVYVPLSTWIVNDENLRPFLIMSQIEESLKDKRINGIGVMKYYGFNLTTLTDKISCYRMRFEIDVFN